MKEYEVRLKFFNNEIEKIKVSANDGQHAFKVLNELTDNGWLFVASMGHPRFVNVNAALEMEIVDIEANRIAEEKRSREALEAVKKW